MNIPPLRFWSYEAHHMRCVREKDYDDAIAQLADMRERLQLIADNSDDKNVVEICRFALEQK